MRGVVLLSPLFLLSLSTAAGCRSARAEADEARRAAVTPRGARLIAIPAATFAFREALTVKAHEVTVAAYQIEATEVTVAAFGACVAAKACAEPVGGGRVRPDAEPMCNWGKAGREDHPINCVKLREAEAYCQWNGGRRLPTVHEAYWAALGDARMSDDDKRNPNKFPSYPWGRADPKEVDHCWKRGTFTVPQGGVISPLTSSTPPVALNLGTCPVASYPGDRSAFGLYDTAGNVSELVFDTQPMTCSSLKGENPCPRERRYRVTGGAWYANDSVGNQSPADNQTLSSESHPWNGFRCVAGPPVAGPAWEE